MKESRGKYQRWYNYPMTLTEDEVKHIALLARLDLSDEEITKYREQLSSILDYAASLQKVDTTGIPPTSSVLPARSVMREDVSRPGLATKTAMQNAPRQELNQFRVPPVLED